VEGMVCHVNKVVTSDDDSTECSEHNSTSMLHLRVCWRGIFSVEISQKKGAFE
jgi:predicted hotdog family 3-hydroxylacyl-ACP dehydratase